MDVCCPSSDSRRAAPANKKVPHKVLLVGRQAQQYRVLLANKHRSQANRHKNVLSYHQPHIMPAHMRPPAPVYRAGVPQMPVRYMTTPSGMSSCTSPHQMITDEIHTFAHMPPNYEYPDGSHLAKGHRYMDEAHHRYYQMVDQYGQQHPKWESHAPNPRMYENTRGSSAFRPRMPAPKHHDGGIYDHSPQFMDGYVQNRQTPKQIEYMKNEVAQQQSYYDHESVSQSPVKFLKSGNSTPGQKHRRYDQPVEEEFEEEDEIENNQKEIQKNDQKPKNQQEVNIKFQQRKEEIQNQSENTLDFRGNGKAKMEEKYEQKHEKYHEEIYDSHPPSQKTPQTRAETPDDVFPPPPRANFSNFNQPQFPPNQNWQPINHSLPDRPVQKMVLNKDSYENTLERPMPENQNSKAPPSAPPRPGPGPTKPMQSENSNSKQFKPAIEQRKQTVPPTRGLAQNLNEVELSPVKHKSTEKHELENWSQLVPHSKVASVIQMLNQKESKGGIFPSGTQTKKNNAGNTPQLQRANAQFSQYPPQQQIQQQRPHHNSFNNNNQDRQQIDQNRQSPHQSQRNSQESPKLQVKQSFLERTQDSNFVPYNQKRHVSTQQQKYQQYQINGYEEEEMQPEEQAYYPEEHRVTPRAQQQKPVPQHRNSTLEDYHKKSSKSGKTQHDLGHQEPAKIANNPPPAPPLPDGGVLKPSASRKNSLNPSAPNTESVSAHKTRSSQQTQNIQEEKSTGTVSVSTDSALSSDDYTNGSNKPSIQGDSTLESTHDLNTEAELLLQYFKNNRQVLNYLGIELHEELWLHIQSLPDKQVKLKIYEAKPTGNRKNSRTQGGKVVRRVSSRGRADKLERRQRKKSNLQEERKRESFLAGQTVAFGGAVISISKGPYPGYAGHGQMVEEVMPPKVPPAPMLMDKRAHPEMKVTEKEIVRDFNDLSRQMNASDTSITIHDDGNFPRTKMEHRSHHQPINRNISVDSLTEDELLKQSNDELEDRRSLKHEMTDGEGDPPAKWNFLKKSGRFVKKSAAALIAKKQSSNTNSPVPTMKVANANAKPPLQTAAIPRKPLTEFKHTEYRIAEEIANLREREDELRRNRSALGLPSLDDIVDTWRHGQEGPRMVPHPRHRYQYEEAHGSPLRGAQSFDHLHIRVQEEKQAFDEFDGTGYTIGPKVAKSESFHHLHTHMDDYYYEKNGHTDMHYGTEQFSRQHKGRRTHESMQNIDPHMFSERVKMQTQDPRFQKSEQIKQVNIKIHPSKRPERSDTLDSNRTAESRRSMRSVNSTTKKKRFFTYAMPVMRL